MDKITEVAFEPLTDSRYLHPIRMRFKQDGKPRAWDLMIGHDSVSILLFHTTKKSLVFVKQFRPAVYANDGFENKGNPDVTELALVDWTKVDPKRGITLELCAGICDKPGVSLVELAKEEIHEECGYNVPVEKIERVTSIRSGVGVSGSKQTYFYAEIDDTMKEGAGGGVDDEMIDIVYVPLVEGRDLIYNEQIPKPPGCLFMLMWFYAEKAAQHLVDYNEQIPKSPGCLFMLFWFYAEKAAQKL